MGEARRRKAQTSLLAAETRLRPLAAAARLLPIVRLTAPAGRGVPSRELAVEALALAERIRETARNALIEAASGGAVDPVLDTIAAIGGGTIGRFEEELRRRTAEAPDLAREMGAAQCRLGCNFCCHVDVVVTPFEAIRLATAMRRGEIPDRAAAVASARRGAGATATEASPCPLLVDGACSAYEIRPFACRSLFSTDAGLCRQGFEGGAAVAVPTLSWPRFLAMGYLTGQIAAMEDLGLASRLTELRSALAILLGDELAVLRWLNGEAIFPQHAWKPT